MVISPALARTGFVVLCLLQALFWVHAASEAADGVVGPTGVT
jgi:hypothetical protein